MASTLTRFACVCLFALAASCGDDGDASNADAASGTTDAATSTDAPASTAFRTDVTFSAGSKTLTGYLTVATQSPPDSAGVLLVHQYQRNDEQWGDLPERLADRGYRVLAFNLRGHGDSDAYDGNLIDILSDPVAAPADVDAALAHLRGPGDADDDRIAIVGTSIGANLAVAAAINDKAKTYVSFSSRKGPAETFAGSAATAMSSVYYLAGQNDSGGQAADAQTMYDATGAPRKLSIYAGESWHGITLLEQASDARGLLLDWLSQNL